MLAKKSEQEILALREFGKNLGIVFQIVDDILDYSASAKNLGKEIGDDFFEGKVTLPIIVAFEKGNAEERQLMSQIFMNNYDSVEEKNYDDFDKVMGIINKYNVLEFAKESADKYCEMALENLKIFENGDISDLESILKYCVKRIK